MSCVLSIFNKINYEYFVFYLSFIVSMINWELFPIIIFRTLWQVAVLITIRKTRYTGRPTSVCTEPQHRRKLKFCQVKEVCTDGQCPSTKLMYPSVIIQKQWRELTPKDPMPTRRNRRYKVIIFGGNIWHLKNYTSGRDFTYRRT